MKKQLLLAAAAVTALVAAGSAQAASVSYRAGVAGTLNDATAVPYVLARELNFAAGVTSSAGDFDVVVVANTPIPAGTYTVQLDFAGATLNAALPNTTIPAYAGVAPGVLAITDQDVLGTNAAGFVAFNAAAAGVAPPTLTLVQGGAAGGNSLTYTLQIPAGNTVTAVGFSPALKVVGDVSVTAGIRNQVGNAFYEPAVVQSLIKVSTDPAFATRVNGRITGADAVSFGSGAGLDTRIDDGAANNPFNTLTNPGQVGQVDVAVAGTPKYDVILSRSSASAPVKRNLIDANVTLADVTSTAITVAGDISGLTFSGVGAAALTRTPANGQSATSVVLAGAPDAAAANSAYTISVAATGAGDRAPQLNPTDLPVSAQLTLNALFAAQPAFTGSFEQIQTDGISYIIPWVTSNAFGNITGSTSVIRISNINADFGNAGGRVYGQLYNPTNIAGVTSVSRAFNFGTLGGNRQLDSLVAAAPAGPTVGTPIAVGAPAALAAGQSYISGVPSSSRPAELVISSVELQNAFGDFGRADLRLTITDGSDLATDNDNAAINPQSIVVKRVIRSVNGSLTEMSVVAGGTGPAPVDQQVPY